MENSSSDKPADRPVDAPVQPRHASSLLIYRSSRDGPADDPEVLLGRRPKGSRFMPDVFVYPGGAVDADDAHIQPASPLANEIAQRLQPSCEDVSPMTLAVTAVRETFEETGLILGADGDIGPAADPSWQTFKDRQLAPALAPLRYIGRAITPAYRPRRFHARFFAVSMAHLDGSLTETDELIELDWFRARRTGDLPMADVTRYMLEQMLDMLETGENWVGSAIFTHKDGKRFVQHDK